MGGCPPPCRASSPRLAASTWGPLVLGGGGPWPHCLGGGDTTAWGGSWCAPPTALGVSLCPPPIALCPWGGSMCPHLHGGVPVVLGGVPSCPPPIALGGSLCPPIFLGGSIHASLCWGGPHSCLHLVGGSPMCWGGAPCPLIFFGGGPLISPSLRLSEQPPLSFIPPPKRNSGAVGLGDMGTRGGGGHSGDHSIPWGGGLWGGPHVGQGCAPPRVGGETEARLHSRSPGGGGHIGDPPHGPHPTTP